MAQQSCQRLQCVRKSSLQIEYTTNSWGCGLNAPGSSVPPSTLNRKADGAAHLGCNTQTEHMQTDCLPPTLGMTSGEAASGSLLPLISAWSAGCSCCSLKGNLGCWSLRLATALDPSPAVGNSTYSITNSVILWSLRPARTMCYPVFTYSAIVPLYACNNLQTAAGSLAPY